MPSVSGFYCANSKFHSLKFDIKFDVVSVRVYEEDAFSSSGPEPGNNNSNKQYHSNQTRKQDP